MAIASARRTDLALTFVVGVSFALMSGCHSSSTSGGSSSTGGKADQTQGSGNGQPSSGQKQGGNPAGNLTEPQYTVNGASEGPTAAASDAGDSSAVAHQSVAMPGAPQGTVPGEQRTGKKDEQKPGPQTVPR